jgi:signal transduction histidine kinase
MVDPWLLALGTVAALAVAGLLWHWWLNDPASPGRCRPFDGVPRPSTQWPSSLPTSEPQALVGEVQDRLGMQLLTARTLAQTGGSLPGSSRLMQLDHQLAQALLSLRLMRDAMRTEPATLNDGLHGLQAHFQPLLAQRGARLLWQIAPNAAAVALPPRSRLNLLRIVQESLDNVLLHARDASTVGLTLEIEHRATGPCLRLSIRDDGHSGSDLGRGSEMGQGVARMERQSGEIGARLAVGPAQPGWLVDLALPLPLG